MKKKKKWGRFTLVLTHLEMVIGYSSTVEIGDSFMYLLWKKSALDY